MSSPVTMRPSSAILVRPEAVGDSKAASQVSEQQLLVTPSPASTPPNLSELPLPRSLSTDSPSCSWTRLWEELVPTAVAHLPLTSYVSLGALNWEYSDCGTEFKHWTLCANHGHKNESLGVNKALVELTKAGWIQCMHCYNLPRPNIETVRIYALPFDVARKDVPRNEPKLGAYLRKLLEVIDMSDEVWSGRGKANDSAANGISTESSMEAESLFYIFNTIQSPKPEPHQMKSMFDRLAAEEILSGSCDEELGMLTKLYPYQRRSVASMIEKECASRFTLDPRLEKLVDKQGKDYYFDHVKCEIYENSSLYEDPKGGVLAETMGFGKTFIIIALILASKDRMPALPSGAILRRIPKGENGTKSLVDMVADACLRLNLPWKQNFAYLEKYIGRSHDACMNKLSHPQFYEEEPVRPITSRRPPPPRKIWLCRATLIVVPGNLFKQWKQEFQKHVIPGALKILEVDARSAIPTSPQSFSEYDVILIDKNRLSLEMGVRPPPAGQDAPRAYPFQNLHFLRLVVDEGHSFASSATNSTGLNALVSVRAEARWIVTGTPSNTMIGAEIEVAADHPLSQPDGIVDEARPKNGPYEQALRLRRQMKDDVKDIKNLGVIVSTLIRTQPWCNASNGYDSASWSAYTLLGPNAHDHRRATVSIRSIMQSLIVRHQFHDVEVDLPPLHNRCVYLEPTTFDKYTMDLFTLVLVCNSITSERTDQDYIFDKRNWRQLDHLIGNFRRSSLYWLGFSKADVIRTSEVLSEYGEETSSQISESDLKLIDAAAKFVPKIVSNEIWDQLIEHQELGYSVSHLPKTSALRLGLNKRKLAVQDDDDDAEKVKENPVQLTVVAGSKLASIQTFINRRIDSGQPDPLRELNDNISQVADVGYDVARKVLVDSNAHKVSEADRARSHKGIPTSGFRKDIQLKPKELSAPKSPRVPKISSKRKNPSYSSEAIEEPLEASTIRLTGTVSAKLSYLLGQVIRLYKQEKILIFYEGDDIAWYISQGLELLGIAHFIYANGISQEMRNKWHHAFSRKDSEERVMLIDLKQGAHGLNITAASRIFFVNPVWSTSAEAQAIKRAHRIGQEKDVYVETLILKDSMEQLMFTRRTNLKPEERMKVNKNPLLDEGILQMLQDFRFTLHSGVSKDDDQLLDSEDFAPIEPAPLLFPELHTYLTRIAAKSRRKVAKEVTNPSSVKRARKENSNGIGGGSQEGDIDRRDNGPEQDPPDARASEKPVKQARFA